MKERARLRPAPAERSARDGVSDSAGIAEAADTTYYAARQLDVYPALLSPLDLRDWEKAVSGARGRALLLLHIDAHGTVDEVSVVEAEPAGYLHDEARRVFRAARFTPALRNGRAVKARVLVRIVYGTDEAAAR